METVRCCGVVGGREGRGSVHCIFQGENRNNLLTYSGICNRQEEKEEEEYEEGLGVGKMLYPI